MRVGPLHLSRKAAIWPDRAAIFWWRRGDPRGNKNSYGVRIRIRLHSDSDLWHHWLIVLFQQNLGRGGFRDKRNKVPSRLRGKRVIFRPTITPFEISGWKTIGLTGKRQDLKWYIRLKAAAGGRVEDV